MTAAAVVVVWVTVAPAVAVAAAVAVMILPALVVVAVAALGVVGAVVVADGQRVAAALGDRETVGVAPQAPALPSGVAGFLPAGDAALDLARVRDGVEVDSGG